MTKDPNMVEMMYWMQDDHWFVFNPSWPERYRLTDKAPERAKKAYAEWLRHQD